MDANVRHLQVFQEVAAHGSVSAAARRVYLSQPAVTQAIGSVERYFGAPLFQRTSSGMTLTAAGQICSDRIVRALDQLRAGLTETSSSSRSAGEHLTRSLTTARLRALVMVVEHRSFSVAARIAGISQPTMHRTARELETALSICLLQRTADGIQPTREAQRLARRARLAFREIAQARAELDALSGRESGASVIGAMPLARSYLLPKVLITFTNERPEHAVSILEGSYENLVSGLQAGEIDFLIGALREPPLHENITQEHLFDDPLAIIMRAGHPIANKRKPSLRALTRFPWVAPRAGSPLRSHFNDMFQKAGVPVPRYLIDCNSMMAARALLLESDRLMLLSTHQIHYELQAGLLIAIPHPRGRVVRAIGLTVRTDWRPTRSQARLLELLRRYSESVPEKG
ncbi:MAG TPA: LysR family transcriptional regulator [Steroidobacteraceae bacterium]|nr:LysR family transcriptional regulator [Steroidobacteraceae bacterium]